MSSYSSTIPPEQVVAVQGSVGNKFTLPETKHHEPIDSPLNGSQPLFAHLGYDDLRTLDGGLLTIVDASFSDRQQRQAVKDLVRQALWRWADKLDRRGSGEEGRCGIPG